MKILILDDDPNRHLLFKHALIGNVVTHTTTVDETIQELAQNHYGTLFLDHDLGGLVHVASGEGTGYAVAKWLTEHPEHIPDQIIVHSFNPVGAANIKAILPQAILQPGAWAQIK